MLVRDHVERKLGFEQVMHAEFPHLRLLPPVEAGDEARRVDDLVTNLLQDHRGVAGIYSLGDGNSGLRAALDRLKASDRPRVVAHELTKHSRSALQDGVFDAILQQDIQKEIVSALGIVRNMIEAATIDAQAGAIRTEIFLRDNHP